jgi:hypothetical protein
MGQDQREQQLMPAGRIVPWLLHTAFFIVVVALAFHLVDVFSRKDKNPVDIVSLELETPVVKQGGELKFVWSFLRHRYCKSTVYEILLTTPDEKGIETVIDRGQVITGSTDLGATNKRRWIYNVPPWIPPGDYALSHIYHSDCGDYVHSQRAPSLHFRVLEKDRAPPLAH